MTQEQSLPVPFFRAFPTGKVVPWHVRRWNGRKWEPVAGTGKHYKAGAESEAIRRNARAGLDGAQ